MGAQLERYYAKAKERSGLPGQVRMAMLTQMTVKDAKAATDTPDNLKMFEEALSKI